MMSARILTTPRCDVADALVKLKIHHGGFLPGITMWSPQRQDGDTKIVGPAYTVQYAPQDNERPKWPSHYVRTPCPGLPMSFHLRGWVRELSSIRLTLFLPALLSL
jgi:regulator of RNase E activity RraA